MILFEEEEYDKRKKVGELANLLDVKYATKFNFRNHCYLRIAYDNTLKNKWDETLKKPFVKYATETQIKNVLKLLHNYLLDADLLQQHNKLSLGWRQKEN